MVKSRLYNVWIRLIELVVIVAILGIVTALSMPELNGIVTRAAATRDFSNARLIYTHASLLIADGTAIAGGDFKENAALLSVVGDIPDTALCTVDITNGAVSSVTYMTAGSPGGLQTFPKIS